MYLDLSEKESITLDQTCKIYRLQEKSYRSSYNLELNLLLMSKPKIISNMKIA